MCVCVCVCVCECVCVCVCVFEGVKKRKKCSYDCERLVSASPTHGSPVLMQAWPNSRHSLKTYGI